MKRIKYSLFHLKHNGWTLKQAIVYLCWGVEAHFRKQDLYFLEKYIKVDLQRMKRQFGEKDAPLYNFNGAVIPYEFKGKELYFLSGMYEDTFLIHTRFGDNYSKDTVSLCDKYMNEGPYGYTDGAFDVTVKKGDIVIDAGAWAGDFSALAAWEGATCYAFEPIPETYDWLVETSSLNSGNGKIVPVNMGLGDKKDMMEFAVDGINGSNRIVKEGRDSDKSLINVPVTTLDAFVEEHNLQRGQSQPQVQFNCLKLHLLVDSAFLSEEKGGERACVETNGQD